MQKWLFKETRKRAYSQGRSRIIGGLSLSCLLLITTFVSALFNGVIGLVVLGIFLYAGKFFIHRMDLKDPLFTDWSNLWSPLHYGIIAATLIVLYPLVKTVYESRESETGKSAQ